MQSQSLSPAAAGSGVNDQQQTPLPAAPPRAPDASVPDPFATRGGRGALVLGHRPSPPVLASPSIFGLRIQQGCPHPAVAAALQPPSGAGHVAGVWGRLGTLPLSHLPLAQHHTSRTQPRCRGGDGRCPSKHPRASHGGSIFKLAASDLHLCFKRQARGLHVPLSAVKIEQVIDKLQTNNPPNGKGRDRKTQGGQVPNLSQIAAFLLRRHRGHLEAPPDAASSPAGLFPHLAIKSKRPHPGTQTCSNPKPPTTINSN